MTGKNPGRTIYVYRRRQWYACQFGHRFAGYVGSEEANLEGHLCPVCVGQVIGHGDMLDPRLLAPVQIPQRHGVSGKQ